MSQGAAWKEVDSQDSGVSPRGVLPHTDARVPPQGLWSGDANCSLGIESFNRGSDM